MADKVKLELFWIIFTLVCGKYIWCQTHSSSYVQPNECSSQANYYDTTLLRCAKCSSGDQASFQLPDTDGYSCNCKPGHKTVNYTNSLPLCEPCSVQEVTSLDGKSCISCSKRNSYQNLTQTCVPCGPGQIRVDRHTNGSLDSFRCVTCVSGTQPDPLGQRCVACLDPLLSGEQSCSCPSATHELAGGMCFVKSDLTSVPDLPSLYSIKYDSLELESNYYCHHARAAIVMCSVHRNTTACQMLANLCTLLHYRYVGERPNSCFHYLKLTATGGTTTGPIHTPPNVPWLYYLSSSVEETLHKKDVDTHFSFKRSSSKSRLNFTSATYNLDGKFLGLSPVQGDTWQLCEGSFKIVDEAFYFGKMYHRSCNVPVKRLWTVKNVFHDPYIFYDGDGNSPTLYAVPVLVKNYVENNEEVNRGPPGKWKFVRRFFLVDNASGRSPCHDAPTLPHVVRYAKNIKIRIEMYRSSGEASKIYPPLITIEYGEATLEDYQANRDVKVSFTVTYEMDQTKEERDFSIAMGVLSAFAILYSAVQTWSWSKRSGRLGIDIIALVKLILFTSGNLATVFLTVTFFTCLYIFIVFKNQDAAYVVLPSTEQEYTFVVFVVVAFFLKLVHLAHVMVVQSMCDIFFMDWERPRAKRTLARPMPTATGDKEDETSSSVSIWRTYLVVNEWAELQTVRKISLGLQILATLFFLKVVGFENLASADSSSTFSSSSETYQSPVSVTCRLAVGIAVYAIVAIVQWIITCFIYEPFIEDKIKQFVDLCSISNISVIILTSQQYGHYIHGRSVHGFADTDMKSIHEQLRREEDNLCSQRGLVPNSDHQTFQMAIPAKLRSYYDHVLTPLVQASRAPGRLPTTHAVPGNGIAATGIERSILAYQTMNRFFASFLEHALRDLDYIVKDKLFTENVMDIEFQDPVDKGFFYVDNGHSYDAALLCGHEFMLTLFDLLMFISIDLAANDFVLAGILTFIINKLIVFMYHLAAKRNLARKTLVDSRFLI